MDIDSCPSSDSRSESPILSLNNSGRILLNIPCKVCRDYSSGKHYGIFACDGCAGFFKRSIRRRRSYLCKARGSAANKCLVDKTHRNQCRACRLKRCIKEGMNKDAVQEERGPRNSTLRRQVALNMQNSTFAAAAAAYANLLPSGAFPGATTPYFTSTGGVGMTPTFGANPFSSSVSPMTSHPHFPSNHFSATLPTVPVSQSSGSLFQPYLPPLFPPPSAQSSAASMIYPKDLEYFRSAMPPTAAPQQPPPSSFQTSSQNSSSPKSLKEEAPVPPNPPISKCSSPSTSTSNPLNTTTALSSHETLLSNYYKQLLCAKDQSQLSSLLFNLYQQRAAVLGGQHQHHHHRAFPHGPPPGSFYPSPYGHYPIHFPDPPLAQSEAPSQPAPADVSSVSPKRKSRKSGPTDAPSLKSSLSSSSSSSASSSSSSSASSSPNQSTPPELIPPPQLPPTNSAPLLVPTFPSAPSVSMHQPYASLMNAMIYSQASQLPPGGGGGLFPTSLDSKMRPLPEPAFFAQHLNWLHSLPPTFLPPPPLPMPVSSVSKVTSPSKSSSNGALSEESQRSIST